MLKNKNRWIIFICLSILFILFSNTIPNELLTLHDGAILTKSEFNELITNSNIEFDEIKPCGLITDQQKEQLEEYSIKYRLFNIFDIKNLKVKVADDKIYVGGKTLGFNVNTKGVIVVGSNYIITKNGKVNPVITSGIKVGDIITKIDNKEIISVNDISDILIEYKENNPLIITYIREGVINNCAIYPAFDIQSKSYKLGLWLKENAMGIGTITYVDSDSNYGALGHAISLDSNGNPLDIVSGKIYNCNVVGVKIGARGQAGQLLGAFNANDEEIGDLTKNCNVGAFGTIENIVSYTKDMKKINLGGKSTAKPGKATILSCIDGKNVKEYSIDIIKTNYQGTNNSKNMIIRITDDRLLNKTGGIVQGMSGSPIIQNGKLVGAVTHVFLNDATKGFGLYIDYMLEAAN